MEGRKYRRHAKKNNKQETAKKEISKKRNLRDKDMDGRKKNGKVLSLISKILIVVLTIVIAAVLGMVIYLKVLPNKYLIPLCIGALVLLILGILTTFSKKRFKMFRIITSAISVVCIGIFSFVGLKLLKTMDFLGNMSTETVNAKTYSVVVLKDSKYTKIEDIQYRLLLYYDTELNKNKEAIDKLTNVMTVVTESTDNVNELANRLIKKEVDAILIEDSYYAIIEEEMADFKDKTKSIYTFTLEDTITTIAKNVSVTKDPFNVFISGIDSYGKISSVARSDVNMLVSVNPQTRQILLLNIPRDYYVKLHGTSGYRDKLTHAGIYGIDMSVKTVEDLFNIDINYYVRVNFTSLINIIDAIGGINVYSEYAFTARIGGYKFVKGYNQMNGDQALGFARERYSFVEGDRMRGQNQQEVINAVIKKVCSSATILTKFDALLDSLKGSFQTNMDYTKMIDLVRMQIAEPAEWTITSIGLDGAGSMERTYSMGKTKLSVLIPYSGSINEGKRMLKSVLNGEILQGGHIDITKYNDYLVVSRGNYATETVKKEEPKEEEKPTVQPPVNNTTSNTPSSGTTQTTKPDSGNNETEVPKQEENTTPTTPDTGNTTPPAQEDNKTEEQKPENNNTGNSNSNTEASEQIKPDTGSNETKPENTTNNSSQDEAAPQESSL